MIDFEVGDIVFWVSVRNRKPFPVNIYKKKGEWLSTIHSKLSDEERIEVEVFVRERIHDMYDRWKPNMKTRLAWEKQT